MGFVGQRTAKLLAFKVGVLKKKSATSAITAKVCARAFSPDSSLPRVKLFLKYDGPQLDQFDAGIRNPSNYFKIILQRALFSFTD